MSKDNHSTPSSDSDEYKAKKSSFDRMLTIYGRKPVLEALNLPQVKCHRIHMADSNRLDGTLKEILALASKQQIEVVYHNRQGLARISRNQKQDQGIAADLICPTHTLLDDFLDQVQQPFSLIAVDGITNPQNLGMIIRSVAASPATGLLLAKAGNTAISPLVVKASAGTAFHCPIIKCDKLTDALNQLNKHADICVLAGDTDLTLSDYQPARSTVYIVGNETEGVSKQVQALATHKLKIPMANNVESLNVAIAASLVAFRSVL